MFAALAVATLCSLPQAPTSVELRAALDALREGQPGQAAFDAAKPRLPELLESRSSYFVEGAAYLIGVHRLGEFAPELVEALRVEVNRPEKGSTRTYSLLLDALIQLDHVAPADLVLAKAREEHAAEAYLALSCEKDEELRADNLARFVALGFRTEAAYWAAAIELALAGDARIVEELLVGAPWELALGVCERGQNVLFGAGVSRRFRSCSHARWPPLVTYQLTLPALTGPLDEIGLNRVEDDRHRCRTRRLERAERGGWRLRLLRELHSEVTPRLAREFEGYLDDASALSAVAGARVDALRKSLTELAHEFAAVGLVEGPDELCKRLSFLVEVHDLRAERSSPLFVPVDTQSVRFVRR